ncbi:MAG: hypothetical protein FIB04_03290 [Gammaproteobacteria bacterium]|nr:hypothetical protein [Gammaproteobacteria bacterium]
MTNLRMPAGVGLLGTGLLLGGCASLDDLAVGETHRLDDAPYYVEISRPQPPPGSCAVVFPVTLDREVEATFGYSQRAAEFEPLLAALNARVAARGHGCIREAAGAPASSASPRVYVGSAESDYAALEDKEQRLPSDRFAPMVLHLDRPGGVWREQAAALVAQAGVPYAIVVQLGVGQYMKGYSGVFTKEVALGTGYRQPIKFLTAEDKPVEVLHLTGVLVDASGKVVRAGAEGVVLRDTPFLAQAVDVSRVFDAQEIERVLSQERRNDLPGSPLKIDVALDNLLAQLTRSAVLIPAR